MDQLSDFGLEMLVYMFAEYILKHAREYILLS